MRRRPQRILLVIAACVLLVPYAPPTVRAATFTVTVATDDDGSSCTDPCSLRQAINAANASPGADTISFAITGTGPHVIAPTTGLPTITGQLTLDATTQPGTGSAPRVTIDGTGAGLASGLRITGSGAASTRISGLAIVNFDGDPFMVATGNGIYVASTSNVTVTGNYLGTDGTNDLGNEMAGVRVFGASGTQIRNNVVSGNGSGSGCCSDGFGIEIIGSGSTSTVIQGNLIGTDATGTADLGNKAYGVSIDSGNNTVGGLTAADRNIVSGNDWGGISLEFPGASNTVTGNYVGTDITGMARIANLNHGVVLNAAGSGTVVGGSGAAGNVISGNNTQVLIDSTNGAVVRGNLLGTTADGTGTIPGGALGIQVVFGNSNSLDGNTIAGVGFSPSHAGILIQGSSTLNTVTGNTIRDNTGDGIELFATSGNRIGGPLASDANDIFGNSEDGVSLVSGGSGNTISGNRIRANGADAADLGIDLGADGVTANDSGDADSGANGLLNFPFITTATTTGVTGTFDSAAGSYRFEFFANTACDGTGYGEGQTFAGAADGQAPGTFDVPVTLQPGDVITATATDSAGNTSEFSACATVAQVDEPSMTVNVTDDATDAGGCTTGHCSLREAILAANAAAGVDTIDFDIDGVAPFTIRPTSALPAINEGVVIDGTTQAGFTGCSEPLAVEIDGSLAGAANGLRVNAGPSTIRGLAINRFTGFARGGIYLSGNTSPGSGGNKVECNFLGTDVTGTVALGNDTNVLVESADNVIGGTTPEQRNIISGSTRDAGVLIQDNGFGSTTNLATRNAIEGNFVGTDVTGTVALPNQTAGVLINGPSGNRVGGTVGVTPGGPCTGACNVVSGNTDDVGIGVNGSGSNVVQGNLVGTTASGDGALGNVVGITVGGPNNTIGGATAAERNVISANTQYGIGVFNRITPGNVIQGNYIGTDASGTAALGNGSMGIFVGDGDDNLIGGTGPGEGNVISANQVGVAVHQGSGDNRIEGNLIGTQPDGTTPLGNVLDGVLISEGALGATASDNVVGGTAAGAGNTIAFNGGNGVTVGYGDPIGVVLGNSILGNSIHSNTGRGIDLRRDGVTANDAGDADTGANDLQNFPILTAASSTATTTTIEGTLNSEPDQTYRLELFSSETCDPSGNGEGRKFVAGVDVTTDAGGDVSPSPFTVNPTTLVAAGQFVTATATDAAGNTSEFAACIVVAADTTITPTLDPPLPPETGVWSWGNGGTGQLGSGTFASRHIPGDVAGLDDADMLSGSWTHTVALTGDGMVQAWGYNDVGQLGLDPSATSCNPYGSSSPYIYVVPCRPTPGAIPGLSDVVAVDAGAQHTLAVQADGDVYSWGMNATGQLGVEPSSTSCTTSYTFGSTTYTYTQRCRPAPERVAGLSGIVAVAAGMSHNLALDADGNVYSWGGNSMGQLGVDPSTTTCDGAYTSGSTTYTYTQQCRPAPAQVAGLSGIVAIAAGQDFSLALDADGNVYSWGYNGLGQLGVEPTATACDRTYTYGSETWTYTLPCRPAPAQVPDLGGVTRIAADGSHAIALDGAGDVHSWGSNFYGQLGVEPSSTSCNVSYGYSSTTYPSTTYTYTQICRATPEKLAGLSGVTAIAAGPYHNLALGSDGDVYGWGANWSGELGEEPFRTSCEISYSYGGTTYTYTSTGCRATPTLVAGISDVTVIGAGAGTSSAAGVASPNEGVKSFTTTAPAGATVTSDVEGDGATADDPVEVSIQTPNGGEVSVSKSSDRSWIGDFSVQGKTIDIEAPNASSVDEPIVLTFVVDVSLFPTTYDIAWLSVYRNGAWVQSCTGPGATPDPCVASRTRLADDDVELVVRTTDASAWTLGVTGPTAEAGGPYEVQEGSSVQLDATASSGTQTPLTYSWSPTAGLDDIGSATPSLDGLDDGVIQVDLTVIDSIGLSSRDVAEVVVRNVAPTAAFENDGPVDAGQPFQLSLTGAQDASPVDTAAGFEYAFDCGDGAGYGSFTAQASTTCSTSAPGTRSVRAKIRDKDGGVSEYTATVEVGPLAVPPTAKVSTTASTCQQFGGGTAPDLIEALYTVNTAGRIKGVSPGNFVYWSKVVAPAASFRITVAQANDNSAFPLYAISGTQLLRDTCAKVAARNVSITTTPGLVTMNVSGVVAGQVFYVYVKYAADPLRNVPVAPQYPEVVSTFSTNMNGTVIGSSIDTLRLKAKP